MLTVALQVEHAGEWWTLNLLRCHAHQLPNTRVELKRLMSDWENSRVFPGGTRMRVETI